MRRHALLFALASAIGLACGGGAREGRQGAPAQPVGARASAVGARAQGELRAPGEPGAVDGDGASDAGACAGCHRAEAAEWSASLHHGSFTDADFQASFAVEPLQFCFGCHAPEARSRGDVTGARVGVGCASCHTVASGHGRENVVASTVSCASCHEFTFPGRDALMQSTVSEHARSTSSGTACATCHMARAPDGHRDHRFDVSRNVALLRASLAVEARRTDAGIELALTARGVGHAMPTGDLFRRLRIAVRAEAADGAHLGEEEVVLARRFDRRRGVPDESMDTRVFGARRVRVEGEWIADAARVEYEVMYERVAQTTDARDVRGGLARRESVFASVLLAEGALSRAVSAWSSGREAR